MVLYLQAVLDFIIVLFAFLSAVFGMIVVNALFKNKLKMLFSDEKFFIFFFLTAGYVLFALGELTWYLIYLVFETTPSAGMSDFYWVTGAFFMLISFIALSSMLYRSYGQTHKLLPLGVFGSLLLIFVFFYVFITGSGDAEGGSVFLKYFYPLMTSLILISSANLFLFYRYLGSTEANLVPLFFANIGFLGGDLLYAYWGASGLFGILAQTSYILAYGLSAFAFFTLLVKFYLHSSGKELLR